jgi:hypothetical protein
MDQDVRLSDLDASTYIWRNRPLLVVEPFRRCCEWRASRDKRRDSERLFEDSGLDLKVSIVSYQEMEEKRLSGSAILFIIISSVDLRARVSFPT